MNFEICYCFVCELFLLNFSTYYNKKKNLSSLTDIILFKKEKPNSI